MHPAVTGSTPVRIGLTGGIGAGKSTVAGIWRDDEALVIDLDAHSRAVLDRPGPGLEEAIARFGEAYRNPEGTVDRAALATLVFSDAEARADLERIVLTRVEAAVAAEEEAAIRHGQTLIVHDSPLLLERGQDDAYHRVVAVLAPRADRVERVLRTRGRDAEYTESVMAAQVTDQERMRRADRLVMNNAGMDALEVRSLAHLRALRQELGIAS